MDEKSYLKIFDQLVKETGYGYYSNNEKEISTLLIEERINKPEYFVFDIHHDKDIFLVFSDQYSVRYGSINTSYGLFMKIPVCYNQIKIRKRFMIDKLNWSRRHKTGSSFIDKNVIILAENKENIPIKINRSSINGFLKITKGIFPIELTTERKSMSMVPLLNGKNWVKLGLSDRWELDLKKLKYLVENGYEYLISLV